MFFYSLEELIIYYLCSKLFDELVVVNVSLDFPWGDYCFGHYYSYEFVVYITFYFLVFQKN